MKLTMNLIKFCENRYQELTLKAQLDKDYDAVTDAETKAVFQILNSYRVLLKWLLVPKCLYDFIMVNLELKDAPKPAMVDKIKADKKKAEKKEAQKLKAEAETAPQEFAPDC